MKTPGDGDRSNTGLGAPIRKETAAPAPIWRAVPGRPDYETDGASIRKKELPPPPVSVYEFFGMPRP